MLRIKGFTAGGGVAPKLGRVIRGNSLFQKLGRADRLLAQRPMTTGAGRTDQRESEQAAHANCMGYCPSSVSHVAVTKQSQ